MLDDRLYFRQGTSITKPCYREDIVYDAESMRLGNRVCRVLVEEVIISYNNQWAPEPGAKECRRVWREAEDDRNQHILSTSGWKLRAVYSLSLWILHYKS